MDNTDNNPPPAKHTNPLRTPADFAPPPQTAVLHLIRHYVPLILKYWWVILPFVVGACFWKWNQIKQEPEQYVCHAKLKITGFVAGRTEGDRFQFQEIHMGFLRNQVIAMQSPTVIEGAHNYLKATQQDYQRSPVSLTAQNIENSTYFQLSAEGSDPKYTQAFLNACIDQFLKMKDDEKDDSFSKKISNVNAQIAVKERELTDLENQLKIFEAENNIAFIEEQASAAGRRLVRLNEELADLKKTYDLMQRFENEGVNIDPSDLLNTRDGITRTSQLRQSPHYVRTAQQLRILEADKARLLKNLTTKHPKIRAIDNQIEQYQIMLDTYASQANVDILRQRRSIEIQIENLQQEIAEWHLKSVDLSKRLNTYKTLNSQIERAKMAYERAMDDAKSLELVRDFDQETITVDQYATRPVIKSKEEVKRIAKSGALGFVAGLGIVLLIIKWNEKIYQPSDLPNEFPLQVAGHIPRVHTKGRVELLQENDQRFAFIESFRSLRSYLIMQLNHLQQEGNTSKIIAVTSAVPSEGKSTVSTNLAISMSLAQNRTLLVDSDMRKGTLHDSFKVPSEPGFVQILRGEEPWWETIVQTPYPNLHFLPRGNIAMTSSELLLSNKCHEFFEEIIYHYDYIVLDTPPVLATDDMANLIQKVDGAILVARTGLSTQKGVRSAMQMLTSRNANMMGYVLNSCEGSSSGYYYKYKYYGNYGSIE